MAKLVIRLRLPQWKKIRWQKNWTQFALWMAALLGLSYLALPNSAIITPQKWAEKLPLSNATQLSSKLPTGWQWEKSTASATFAGRTWQVDAPLALGLDIQGGVRVIVEADTSNLPSDQRALAMESVESVLRRRVDLFGISETTVTPIINGSILRMYIDIPGLSQSEEAIELIGQTAQLQFRRPPENWNVIQATDSSGLAWTLFTPTDLDGGDLERATVSFDPTTNEPQVALQFNSEGARLFGELTTELTGQPIGLFLDDVPLSLPVVQEPILGGQSVISGSFDLKSAQVLASQLSAGALPTPVSVIGQEIIGPSLGQEALNKSAVAGLLGLSLVAVFMLILYGWWGFIALLGLVAYAIVTIALYKQLPITLTLPGIAGLVLSIGMAVDANILTFARLRRELNLGTAWPIALQKAFGRSWDSIKDANLATLTICFLLGNPLNWSWLPVSGPVRGFAITLAIGVGISLLTGVVFSRLLLRLFAHDTRKERA